MHVSLSRIIVRSDEIAAQFMLESRLVETPLPLVHMRRGEDHHHEVRRGSWRFPTVCSGTLTAIPGRELPRSTLTLGVTLAAGGFGYLTSIASWH